MRIIIVLLLIFSSFIVSAQSPQGINIIVDNNLAIPMQKLVRKFVNGNYISVSTQFSRYAEILNFNNKDTDIIITANENAINFLKKNDLIEKNILYIAHDILVLISSDLVFPEQANAIQYLESINKNTGVVIIDPYKSLSGFLAEKLLLSLNINNIIQVKDEEKALYLVKNNQAVGVLLKSGTNNIDNLHVMPLTIDHSVKYQAVILKHKASERTNSFLKFLLLNKIILKEHEMIING